MLALGTAQFSSNYGILNKSGKKEKIKAENILRKALELGICNFDTAAAYRNSEAIVGSVLRMVPSCSIKVTTKGSILGEGITASVKASLNRLGLTCVDSWLLHNEQELYRWGKKTSKHAWELKEKGKVMSFGASVYHPENAEIALKDILLDTIQFPGSILDRRFFRNRNFIKHLQKGRRATVRSIYLQGLCLSTGENALNNIPYAKSALRCLNSFCRIHKIERDAFCMQYVLNRIQGMNVDVLVGADSLKQLERNVVIFKKGPLSKKICDAWDDAWPHDYLELVLPQYWFQQTAKIKTHTPKKKKVFISKALEKKSIKKIQLGQKIIGSGHEPRMFAEEGQANQGNILVAMSMCEKAAKAGADGIEFQLFLADDMYARSHPNHHLYKSNELSRKEIRQLISFAHSQGLIFQVAGLSPDIIKYCAEEGADSFCVNATDLTNPLIIDAVSATGRPFWLATLMGTIEEIDWAVKYALSRSRSDIGLLHGQHVMSSGHGAGVPPELLQLDCINAMQKRYGLTVGFVDHTSNVFVPSLAAAKGAAVVMKHLAPRKNWKGPDWQVALDPDGWKKSREILKYSFKTAGNSKEISLAEIKDKSLHRRSLFTRKPLFSGHRLSEGDLVALRPGAGGINPSLIHKLLGRKIAHNVPEQHQLQLDDLV